MSLTRQAKRVSLPGGVSETTSTANEVSLSVSFTIGAAAGPPYLRTAEAVQLAYQLGKSKAEVETVTAEFTCRFNPYFLEEPAHALGLLRALRRGYEAAKRPRDEISRVLARVMREAPFQGKARELMLKLLSNAMEPSA